MQPGQENLAIEIVSSTFDEFLVLKAFWDNGIPQTVDPGNVGARCGSEPFFWMVGQFHPPGINEIEFFYRGEPPVS